MIARRRLRGSTSESGVTLVEFALVTPIIILILMGTFDLGWAVFANNMLASSAREGARAGIISSTTDAQIRQRVKDVSPGLNLQDSNILIARFTSSDDDFIKVTVNYSYVPVFPLLSTIVGGQLALSSAATMLVE